MQKSSLRILQVIPFSYHVHSGGVEKISQTISDGLKKNVYIEIKNLASDGVRGEKKDLQQFYDTIFQESFDLVYNFPVPKFWKTSFWKQIHEIKQWKPHVIMTHTRFFLQSMMGGIFAKLRRCKRIHIEHGSGFVTGYPRYIKLCAWLFDWTIGLWIFRQCDTVITISEMHKKFISKFTTKDPLVIYNPVDYQKQETSHKAQNDLVHIGFIGRLVPLKGVNLLIDALKQLEQKSWKCSIVGDGSERARLEQQVNALGLGDRISFVGFADRSEWLPKFDILVNPSYQEGVPTIVVEGLMQGCIVVATDVGGTREISDKEDLILVKSGSIEQLKSGIEKAFLFVEKSGGSYEIVKERFGLEGAIGRYKECLLF